MPKKFSGTPTKIRLFEVVDLSYGPLDAKEKDISLLALSQLTDFSPEEFDAVASLSTGECVNYDSIKITRTQ